METSNDLKKWFILLSGLYYKRQLSGYKERALYRALEPEVDELHSYIKIDPDLISLHKINEKIETISRLSQQGCTEAEEEKRISLEIDNILLDIGLSEDDLQKAASLKEGYSLVVLASQIMEPPSSLREFK